MSKQSNQQRIQCLKEWLQERANVAKKVTIKAKIKSISKYEPKIVLEYE